MTRTLVVLAGSIAFLLIGSGLFYFGAPVHTTSIIEHQPNEQAMATALDEYSSSEVDAIAFTDLSDSEQKAIEQASKSSTLVYNSRGVPTSGEYLDYTNNVKTDYFVRYDGAVIQVATAANMRPILMAEGALISLLGFVMFGIGIWPRRGTQTTSERT